MVLIPTPTWMLISVQWWVPTWGPRRSFASTASVAQNAEEPFHGPRKLVKSRLRRWVPWPHFHGWWIRMICTTDFYHAGAGAPIHHLSKHSSMIINISVSSTVVCESSLASWRREGIKMSRLQRSKKVNIFFDRNCLLVNLSDMCWVMAECRSLHCMRECTRKNTYILLLFSSCQNKYSMLIPPGSEI